MLLKKKKQILIVGDLVTHILYSNDWIGMVLKMQNQYSNLTEKKKKDEVAYVHMVPGSEYEYFFLKRYSAIAPHVGLISTRWLLKVENTI